MIRLVLHATARHRQRDVVGPGRQRVTTKPDDLLGVPPLAHQLQRPAGPGQPGRLVEIRHDGGHQLGLERAGKIKAGGFIHLALTARQRDLGLTRRQPQLVTEGGIEPERVDPHIPGGAAIQRRIEQLAVPRLHRAKGSL